MARSFKEFFAKAKQGVDYWAELAVLDFTAALDERMRETNVSRAELAKRVGTSPAYITKVLNGTTNFTIKSMASLAHALGQKITIVVQDESADEVVAPVNQMVVAANAAITTGRLVLLERHHALEFDAVNESTTVLAEAA